MRGLLVLSVLLLPIAAVADPDPNEIVWVPAGTFIMGDGLAYCGVDERDVTLTHDFYFGQHEVTNQEYMTALQWAYDSGYVTVTFDAAFDNLDGSTEELIDISDQHSEIMFDGTGEFYLREVGYALQHAYPNGYDPGDHPVKLVSWFGAVRYCDWLSLQAGLPRAYEHSGDWLCNSGDPYRAEGYRLPTDAEWEYAAQWDDERAYPWGDEDPRCSWVNFFNTDFCVGWTSPVGSYVCAPEALGLSDVAGNMFEWCNDWWICDLGADAQINPSGPDNGTLRVIRGGAWDCDSQVMRCAFRFYCYPYFGDFVTVGFRIARSVPPSSSIPFDHNSSEPCLYINHPNPFTTATQITFSVPPGPSATLTIHDASGRFVRTLVSRQFGGEHTISWDGTNDVGDPVETGAYFYRLTVGEQSVSRRMLLVR